MINPWDIPARETSQPTQDQPPVGGGKRGAGSIPGLLRALVFSPLLTPVVVAIVVAIPLGALVMVLVNGASACFGLYDRLVHPEQRQADDAAYAAAVNRGNVIPFHNGTHSRTEIVSGAGKVANDTGAGDAA